MPGKRVRSTTTSVSSAKSAKRDKSSMRAIKSLSADISPVNSKKSSNKQPDKVNSQSSSKTEVELSSTDVSTHRSATKNSFSSRGKRQNSCSTGSSKIATPPQQLSDVTAPRSVARRLTSTFFDQPCVQLARGLLGKRIVRILPENGYQLCGRIVETEAYIGPGDRAAHSFGGKRTARNEAMYMSPGTSYVYNIYGIYCCINISSRGDGAAILIRALEPIEGHSVMQKNRGLEAKGDKVKPHDLCNGPSKLTKALSIEKSNGDQVDLTTCSYLWLEDGEQVPDSSIVACSRIGIDYAQEWASKPLRFYVRGCRSVSVRNKAAEETSTGT